MKKNKPKTLTVTKKDYEREIASGVTPEDAMSPGNHQFYRASRLASPEDIQKRNIKLTLSIRLDADIVDFFKARASQPDAAPYQTQINAALRGYMQGSGNDYHQDLLRDETFIAAVADRVRNRV